MALPARLASLSTREAIQDTLARCIQGLDTADTTLFTSAFTDDAVFDLNGTVLDGLSAIISDCYNGIAKLDTTHFLTNTRIHVEDGASTAAVSASAVAYHYRPGDGMKPGASRFVSGSLYTFKVVKPVGDDLWKIKHWTLKLIWTEGDFSIITGD